MKLFAITGMYETIPNNSKTNNVKRPKHVSAQRRASKTTIYRPNENGVLALVRVAPQSNARQVQQGLDIVNIIGDRKFTHL
jgi:hypothetical protein